MFKLKKKLHMNSMNEKVALPFSMLRDYFETYCKTYFQSLCKYLKLNKNE